MAAADIRAVMEADGAEDVRAVVLSKTRTVYVREMSAGERDRWVKKSRALQDEMGGDLSEVDPSAFMAAMIICDEAGTRVYDPLNKDDLAFLSKRSQREMDLILASRDAPEGN